MRYFEDFPVGEIMERGPYVVTREEIISFARQFDPQPFHIDEDAAGKSIYGGIIASGWHTAAICHKLMVEGLLGQAAGMGSPGLDELRWKKPVRPGDSLRIRIETLEAKPSTSKPDRGALKLRLEVVNQNGEVVMTEVANALFARRPPSP
ncbi:MaoC family dehydratase [Corallococcus sp. AB004]|uniref:MaoC family dehydratase n=1 Tax=Corallococcus exiguus TaxID=83462 RepID=UPI000EA26C39|nr:MaoC family dehydratase [Corallococcus exiguus]NPC73766.1 MaoC family dehydratase [Corallococcus exiguus]RKI36320.1 MaoC family dehydratase [Corallococcus sp. AB004]